MALHNQKTVLKFLDQEKAELAGYLWKRRSERKGSYKKRYFIVCGNILSYYDKKSDKDPLGILFLEGHVLEMVDDLTIALKFYTQGDINKVYFLRGESSTVIEEWLRVLSRSGIDFISLTLEDLEDQLNAVTAVKRSSTLGLSVTFHGDSDKSASVSPALRRRNPFNDTFTTTDLALRNMTLSDRSTAVQKLSHSSSMLPHSVDYTNWLSSQTWEILHARARSRFAGCGKTEPVVIIRTEAV